MGKSSRNVGCWSVGSTWSETRSSTSWGHVRRQTAVDAPARASPAASASRSRSARMSIPVRSSDGAGQRLAPPRRGEVELALVAHRLGHRVHEALAAVGDVEVVGVGLVPLHHGELGVVGGVDALVAEVLADLVDALEPTHDQPLEVELGGDAQVQIAVQGVVMRRERARHGAAVERLQDGRLDLDEALVVQEATDGGDHPGARDEPLARLRVGHEVQLAVAVARLDVGEAVVLVGRRAQGLGQQLKGVDAQRQLAAPRHERGAVDPDQVAEVQRQQPVHRLRAEHVDAAPGAGSGPTGPRGPGRPSCPGRAAPRDDRRRGVTPRSPRPPRVPRAPRAPPRSARRRRTRTETARLPAARSDSSLRRRSARTSEGSSGRPRRADHPRAITRRR